MSFISIGCPLCQLLNLKSNVTLLVASVFADTLFHCCSTGFHILATLGTLIFSSNSDVSTSHSALTGNVSPVNGCLNVTGSEIIPHICLL